MSAAVSVVLLAVVAVGGAVVLGRILDHCPGLEECREERNGEKENEQD